MSRSFAEYAARCPLIAIIRGVRPNEVGGIGRALVDAGFGIIEVPLNSPDPFASVAALADAVGDTALVGSGTNLSADDVIRTHEAGGRLIVSPNTDAAVIAEAVRRGMVCMPGIATPSEAFAAIAAGATGLKLFPAEGFSPGYLKSMRAVLPKDIPVYAVGGIDPDNMARWLAAGADGFGLGGSLYKPGMSAQDVGERARAFVSALAAARA